MTLERARQLLKEDGSGLNDDQLQGLLDAFSNLADVSIEIYKKDIANNVATRPQ